MFYSLCVVLLVNNAETVLHEVELPLVGNSPGLHSSFVVEGQAETWHRGNSKDGLTATAGRLVLEKLYVSE